MTHIADHVVSGVPLLEALRATEASIAAARRRVESCDDSAWDFSNWTQCTCGHIYFGATGSRPDQAVDVLDSRSATFRDILRYVAAANGLVGSGAGGGSRATAATLAIAVSSATIDRAGAERVDPHAAFAGSPTAEENEALRVAALELVRTAIAAAELESLAAMVAVAERAATPRELAGAPT